MYRTMIIESVGRRLVVGSGLTVLYILVCYDIPRIYCERPGGPIIELLITPGHNLDYVNFRRISPIE